ncbi:hypothetical protein AO262_12985 [Pseudomonas fluorescens ABAC62]|nr:hypothetical protein AO262_12985 [Pseudomonas fluorescens ABAC62]
MNGSASRRVHCHSDLHTARNGWHNTLYLGAWPEIVGRVTAVGGIDSLLELSSFSEAAMAAGLAMKLRRQARSRILRRQA